MLKLKKNLTFLSPINHHQMGYDPANTFFDQIDWIAGDGRLIGTAHFYYNFSSIKVPLLV